jgi:hypothetical protein
VMSLSVRFTVIQHFKWLMMKKKIKNEKQIWNSCGEWFIYFRFLSSEPPLIFSVHLGWDGDGSQFFLLSFFFSFVSNNGPDIRAVKRSVENYRGSEGRRTWRQIGNVMFSLSEFFPKDECRRARRQKPPKRRRRRWRKSGTHRFFVLRYARENCSGRKTEQTEKKAEKK